jgi:hypothetical protein
MVKMYHPYLYYLLPENNPTSALHLPPALSTPFSSEKIQRHCFISRLELRPLSRQNVQAELRPGSRQL